MATPTADRHAKVPRELHERPERTVVDTRVAALTRHVRHARRALARPMLAGDAHAIARHRRRAPGR